MNLRNIDEGSVAAVFAQKLNNLGAVGMIN